MGVQVLKINVGTLVRRGGGVHTEHPNQKVTALYELKNVGLRNSMRKISLFRPSLWKWSIEQKNKMLELMLNFQI